MDTYKIIPYNKFKKPESHASYWKSKAVECMKEMDILDSILIHNRTYETAKQWIKYLEYRMGRRGLKMKFILQREYRLGSADDKRIIKIAHEKIPFNNKANPNEVSSLSLSVRTHNALMAAGIESIAELTYLIKNNPIRLLRLKNFGRKCLREVTTTLKITGDKK